MSPTSGTSTLTTCAPKSPNMVEQKGPARAWDRSRILTSSSGIFIVGVSPFDGVPEAVGSYLSDSMQEDAANFHLGAFDIEDGVRATPVLIARLGAGAR